MKKLFSLLLSLTLLLSMVPATTAVGFTDVDAGAWYADAVDYVVSNNLMSGYNETTFGTNDALSRAMVVQILYNKEGKPAQSGSHGFTDVKSGDWFNNAVTWGTRKGVMSGYGNGIFKPNDNVTLEQIAVILWNYAGNPAFSGTADAIGVHSSWAANGLAWAIENNLFANLPFVSVTAAATRAQTAQMLTNYLAAKPAVSGITLDITNHTMGEDWTQYLTATLYPAGVKDTITWTSSNPRVATVDQKGKVSGVAGGTTTITARTSNGKTATCKVEVWHSHKLTDTQTKNGGTLEIYTCPCGDSYENWIPLTLPGKYPMELVFTSGAGGWGNYLVLNADGSFEGLYYDSEMGVTGYGYPNGTEYVCPYQGQFSVVEKVDSTAYILTLSSLVMAYPVGTTWIDGGVRYITTEPYGLTSCKYFEFYTPDAPVEDFLDGFIEEAFPFETVLPKTLGRYCIWNSETGCGFFTY